MSGQSAMKTREEIKSTLRRIETNLGGSKKNSGSTSLPGLNKKA